MLIDLDFPDHAMKNNSRGGVGVENVIVQDPVKEGFVRDKMVQPNTILFVENINGFPPSPYDMLRRSDPRFVRSRCHAGASEARRIPA